MSAVLFRAGDVVQLKSGGPRMTYTGVNSDDRLWCMWFDKQNVQHSAGFTRESLVAAQPVVPTGTPSS